MLAVRVLAFYKALPRETGGARASIQRFIDGRQSLRLDMADRFARFLRLVLIQRRMHEGDQQ